MTENERILVRCLRMNIGDKKRELKHISKAAANGNMSVLNFVQPAMKAIREYQRIIDEIENEDQNILESFDDYVHWGCGSEDGDYVFSFVRDDRRHADHMRQKMKRAKKWEKEE